MKRKYGNTIIQKYYEEKIPKPFEVDINFIIMDNKLSISNQFSRGQIANYFFVPQEFVGAIFYLICRYYTKTFLGFFLLALTQNISLLHSGVLVEVTHVI